MSYILLFIILRLIDIRDLSFVRVFSVVVVVVVVVDVVLVVVVFDISVHQLQVVGHKVGFLNSLQVEQPSAPASAILFPHCPTIKSAIKLQSKASA